MKLSDFENVEGFKEKLSNKIYDSIHDKVKKASLLQIAAASNKLGRGIGERKLKPILEKYPNFSLELKQMKKRKFYYYQ